MFPEQFDDSIWIKRQKDSLQLLLQLAVDKNFPKKESLEKSLTQLFKHIKFYFPQTPIPHTIGLINNVDYQSKTIYRDSLLILSLDTYLGEDNELYEGIPKYIRQQMDEAYLTSHVADKFLVTQLNPLAERTFWHNSYTKVKYNMPSPYSCPIFQKSSVWVILSNNSDGLGRTKNIFGNILLRDNCYTAPILLFHNVF